MAAAPRNIFVYHTDIQTTEEDILAVIDETSKVNVLQIEKRVSHKFVLWELSCVGMSQ